ncbi:AK17A protein, partial [Pseudoatta argentina]
MSDNKQVGETPSSEVANRFRSCRDLSDIVPLYPSHALYLKPLAKVNVSVSLPQLKTPGKTISTWEVMEKIRALILPDEFAFLKVAKSTLEFIRLEGDLRDRCRLPRVLARLDLQQLNLSGFSNVLKVRAAEAKDDFPTRHSWNSYFRDAKHMNELKAGERPDTIHITGLPVKWFTEDNTNVPSESLITKIFKKWGALRKVDVPAADSYRSRMRLGNNIHKFSFEDGIFFDVYVQYVEYMDFVRAMDALRGMKLLKKDGQNSLTATLKIDFDKTKHLSDNSISHRDFERKRLIAQDNLAAEKMRKREEAEKKRQEEQRKKEEADSMAKANRQRNREEKRKRKALTKFRKQEEDKVSMKIAREEQKLIKAQRQLESIRLLDELFDRIKTKVEKKEIKLDQNMEKKGEKKNNQTNEKKIELYFKDTKMPHKRQTRYAQFNLKDQERPRKKTQKKRKKGDNSSESTTEEESDKETSKKRLKSVLIKNDGAVAENLPYDYSDSMSVLPSMAPFHAMRMPRYARRQMMRSPGYSTMSLHHPMIPVGRGRGFVPRYEMNYTLTNPYLYNGQYYEYFTHLVERDSKQQKSKIRNRQKSTSRSISRTRTRSGSRKKSRSISRSRSRRRSGSRSKSRDQRSKSRSRSRSHRSRSRLRRSRSRLRRSRSQSRRSRSQSRKSKSRSRRPKSRSRNRSRSRSRRKSASRSCSRRKTRSRSNSKTRHKNNKSCSRSKSSSKTRPSRSRRNSRSRSRSKSRSRNRYRSKRGKRSSSIVKVTRAKSRPTSPRRRSRSSSWSLPKSPSRRSCSWSRAASANNINEQDVNKESEKLIQEETAKTEMLSTEAN